MGKNRSVDRHNLTSRILRRRRIRPRIESRLIERPRSKELDVRSLNRDCDEEQQYDGRQNTKTPGHNYPFFDVVVVASVVLVVVDVVVVVPEPI